MVLTWQLGANYNDPDSLRGGKIDALLKATGVEHNSNVQHFQISRLEDVLTHLIMINKITLFNI